MGGQRTINPSRLHGSHDHYRQGENHNNPVREAYQQASVHFAEFIAPARYDRGGNTWDDPAHPYALLGSRRPATPDPSIRHPLAGQRAPHRYDRPHCPFRVRETRRAKTRPASGAPRYTTSATNIRPPTIPSRQSPLLKRTTRVETQRE